MGIKKACFSKLAFYLVLAGCLQFIVLTIAAMLVYPGGTYFDYTTTGYSFWLNFFSDLGRTTTFLGEANTLPHSLFSISLVLIGAAFIAFALAMPSLFQQTRGLNLSRVGSGFGVISALSFIGIALTPYDLYFDQHFVLVYVAFLSFLLMVLMYIPAIFKNSAYPNLYAYIFVGFAVVLAVYITLIFTLVEETAEIVAIRSTAQKIVVYTAIVAMAAQSLGAMKVYKALRNTN